MTVANPLAARLGIGTVVANRCRIELVLAADTITPGIRMNGRAHRFKVGPVDLLVTVRIPAVALDVGIDSGKARAALEKHRDLIELRARERYRPGDEVVTLEVRDLKTV
jgi:hypothetical protein